MSELKIDLVLHFFSDEHNKMKGEIAEKTNYSCKCSLIHRVFLYHGSHFYSVNYRCCRCVEITCWWLQIKVLELR